MHFFKELGRREVLKTFALIAEAFCFFSAFPANCVKALEFSSNKREENHMKLPKPRFDGKTSVEKAIKRRRTNRSFLSKSLTLEQLSQILWASQGITEEGGFKRAAPSAGALYPMDVYAIVGKNGVESLKEGIYHYEANSHSISILEEGDFRARAAETALWQMWMARAPLSLVITAEYNRVCGKYGERGVRYAMIEAGHIGQNIFLQACALGLSAGIIGAFRDHDLNKTIRAPASHEPLLVMPVGYES